MQKALRLTGIIVLIGIILAAIITSVSYKPSNAEKVWDPATTIGNIDAKNYFIVYSDLVCPYCVAFENAIVENEAEFQDYITKNDILLEIRLSDFLYEYGESSPINSRYSAEAVYCAKNEGRFWDYYNRAISAVWNDYFKGAGKAAFTELNKLDKNYWINLGKEIGLSNTFESCVTEDQTLAEVQQNAERTSHNANGMPYFKFNKFTTSGFDLSSGWQGVLNYFESGLKSQK